MQKIDLLNCPFCGKLETLRMIYVPAEKRECVYHVVCDAVNGGCGASTGWNHSTPEEAAEEWNTRASSWIPCSERLPEEINGKSRIVFASVRHIDTVNLQITWTERGKWYTSGTVTHWMPLPSLPEVKNNVD